MKKLFDFNVENIEYVVKRLYHPNSKYTISQKNTYRLVYILSGEADFIFEDKIIKSKNGDVIFLAPKNDHDVKIMGSEIYTFITISFVADLPLNFSMYIVQNPSAREIFKRAYKLYSMDDMCKDLYIKGYIYNIVADIIKSQNPINNSKPEIETTVLFIKKNYCKKLTVNDIAAISGYSPSHFKRLFFEQEGISPIRYINNLRISKAKNLLKSNMFTVTEIAENCGFENVYYFSNVFKKYTEFSPKEYLKSINY